MPFQKFASGSLIIDDFLNGGIEKGAITNFYGPPGSGKTNISLIFTLAGIKDGKVAYIDTENGFSVERFFQLGGTKDDLKKVFYDSPRNFKEQIKSIKKLKDLEINLVIVDSVVSLYRLEINKDNFTEVNKQMATILAELSFLAKDKKIPVIITNHVYSVNSDEVELSGRDVVKYWSKCLIELKKVDDNRRLLILRKHRSMPEGKKVEIEITERGIDKAKFRIF